MHNHPWHWPTFTRQVRLLTCALWLALGLLPWPVGAQTQATGQLPARITVVLDDNYPPYIFRDASGQIQGILKDSWALWEARTGVAVDLQAMDWAAAQQFMQAGRADVIDTLFINENRQRSYDFTAPYATLEVPLFFHHSIGGIVNAASLKGFTVGVKAGDACIDELRAQGVNTLQHYPSYSALVAGATAGDVRVFCMDKPPAIYLLNQRGMAQDFHYSAPLFTGQFHRAVRKGDAALLKLVQDGFGRITAAEYQAIETKWNGNPIDQDARAINLRYLAYALGAAALLALLLMGWNLTLRQRVLAKTAALTQALDEQKAALQARDEALARLQKLTNRVPGFLYQYLLRPNGSACFPYASEAIQAMYGISPEQAKVDAAPVFANGFPEELPGVIASINESAAQLSPWQYEYRVKQAHGEVRWLYGNALPERLDDGSVLWHGFVTDITERKRADEQLRQLSRSVEQAPVSIVITNLMGNILYANPSFSRCTGYSLAEARGQNPRILQSGHTPREVYVQLWDTISRGGVWQGELQNRKKNGELFTEYAVIAPVFDASGATSHYVAIKEDITLRKQADLALQTSLQEKVALLNEVHHRVKNNLQVITSLLRLEAGRCTQPDTKGVLQDMQGRIRSMALLHESLYRAGNFAAIDLAAYLKQLATQAFRAQSHGAVRLQLALDPLQVSLDQATPCGLLVNELLSNGLKHAFPAGRAGELQIELHALPLPGDGSAETAAQAPDPLWRLCVRDNGVGLPSDFEQRRTQSLGLQLASDLARQLGGTLSIGSAAADGTGASFAVVFLAGKLG